jgi:DNA-binding FadR family transcriptional regulator
VAPILFEKLDSDLLRYIISRGKRPGDRLPALEELSAELKISTGKLREQLEVARALGFVDVKPRNGIRLAEFNFLPAVRFALMYALAADQGQFEAFGQLRNHVEAVFWREAVTRLTAADHAHLRSLIAAAWAKLDGQPIVIPHAEHRELHLAMFRRLGNPFVLGLLEAYWEAYEAVGLSMFSDYQYLRDVWTYHESIVDALEAGNADEGYRLLQQHTTLLRYRGTPRPSPLPAASQPGSATP